MFKIMRIKFETVKILILLIIIIVIIYIIFLK